MLIELFEARSSAVFLPIVPLETVRIDSSESVPILKLPPEILSSILFKSKAPLTVVVPPV